MYFFQPPGSAEKFTGYLPINELDITYSRSSGPGGQNVNKVNTKVDVRFNVQSASWIHSNTKAKLLDKVTLLIGNIFIVLYINLFQYKTKLTNDGFLVFRSELTRSQQLNLADCLEKIRVAIRNVEVEPVQSAETPEKIRRRYLI